MADSSKHPVTARALEFIFFFQDLLELHSLSRELLHSIRNAILKSDQISQIFLKILSR